MQNGHQFGSNEIQYSPRSKRLKSSKDNVKFLQQEVNLKSTPLYFPEGFEKIFLAMYFILLPFITGLLFLFFFNSMGKYEVFLSLNQDYFFILTWAIGYEILAILILLYIIKSAFSFSEKKGRKGKNKRHISR
ncbi:MAG: hypothetical protein J7J02_03400 [Sulfurovum sp.]|nr:hypothetical protein [Sulfurovum sp.]